MDCDDPDNCHVEFPTCALCRSARALHEKVSPVPWHKTTPMYRRAMRLHADELISLGPEPPEAA